MTKDGTQLYVVLAVRGCDHVVQIDFNTFEVFASFEVGDTGNGVRAVK